jgi:hypothetical protein
VGRLVALRRQVPQRSDCSCFVLTEKGYDGEIFSPKGGKCEADTMSDPRDASGYSATCPPNDGPSAGNLFVYAPRQKVLMLVDVVYPGYLPYPDLGVAVDTPGYIQAHREALTYEFSEFVGGHVDRLGTRADVEASLAFVLDLKQAAEAVLAERPFPTYLRQRRVDLSRTTWFAHDDYEQDRVARCYARLAPQWTPRLKGTARILQTHCRAMIVALAIQMPPPGMSSTAGGSRRLA